jgi:hypothetical protein
VLFVRYEDVVAGTEDTLRSVLEFCGLDVARFDFAAATDAPVIGSSFVRTGSGGLTWKPQERGADFKPTNRFEQWGPRRRARFDHLAGDLQRQLGYESATEASGRWNAFNRVADVLAPVVRARDAARTRYEHWKATRRS